MRPTSCLKSQLTGTYLKIDKLFALRSSVGLHSIGTFEQIGITVIPGYSVLPIVLKWGNFKFAFWNFFNLFIYPYLPISKLYYTVRQVEEEVIFLISKYANKVFSLKVRPTRIAFNSLANR